MTRNEILTQLREKLSRSQPIRAGLVEQRSSKLFLASDLDLGVLYHTAQFPGLNPIGGLLPFADANKVILDLAQSGLPEQRPIVAGVCGTDPFRLMEKFLDEIEAAGFCGVQNFPSIGAIDGDFRAHLENSKIGYAKELELIAIAHERGFLTMPLVFTEDDAIQMAHAGADILVIHPQIDGITTTSFAKAMLRVEAIAASARKIRKTIIPVVHVNPAQADVLAQGYPGINGVFMVLA